MRCGVFLAACLLSLPANAGPAPFCLGAARLQPRVVNCATNYSALAASDRCVKGVDEAILAAQARLAAAMARLGQAERAGQQGDLANSGADLAAAQATFQELLATARAVRAEVALYPLLISLPGGVSRRAAASNRNLAALARFDCYKDPLLVLKSDIASLDQKIADLERGAQAAAGLSGRTGRTIENLVSAQGAPGPAALLSGKGQGGIGSTVTGEAKRGEADASGGASSISGKSVARLATGSGGEETQEQQSIAEAQGSLLRALGSRGTGARARLEETGSAGTGEEATVEALRLAEAEGGAKSTGDSNQNDKGASVAGEGEPKMPGGERLPAEASAKSPAPGVQALGALNEKLGEVMSGSELAAERSLFERTHAAHERAQGAGRVNTQR